MSITLGNGIPAPRPPWVILIGGTGSASEVECRRVYGGETGCESMASAMFPDALPRPAPFISDWPGGFPVEGFPDPRKIGLRNLTDAIDAIHDRGVRKIGIVGFSHGGWIAMRAMEQMLQSPGWKDADLRLLTLAAPPLKENATVARRLGQYVDEGRLRWLGLMEDDDPVATEWAGIIEHLIDSPDGSYQCESLFRRLRTSLDGIPAHDKFPARSEVRDAVRTFFRA